MNSREHGGTNIVPFPQTGRRTEGIITLNGEQCKGCGLCIRNCPKNILKVGKELNSLGYAATVVDCGGDCIGCTNCFYTCPEPGAINLKIIKKEIKKTA